MQAPGSKINVKVVVIGDSGVGKTSISNRFCNDNFHLNELTTLGTAFSNKIMQLDDQYINYSIWDTAGQEQYQSIVSVYYKDAQVALIVYDITSRKSFERLKMWVNELNVKGPRNLRNKVDLIEQEEVKYDEVQKFANEIDAIFKLTSAKEDQGIKEMFKQIGQKIIDQKQQMPQIQSKTMSNAEATKLQAPTKTQKKKNDCEC